jgi:hypothetical protein
LAAVRRACWEQDGILPSIGPVDELLDERRELDRKLTGVGLRPDSTIFVEKTALLRIPE